MSGQSELAALLRGSTRKKLAFVTDPYMVCVLACFDLQEFMPLTAYQGVSFVRNTHGARVMLVPDAYKEVLQGGAMATAQAQGTSVGAGKSVTQQAAGGAAAAANAGGAAMQRGQAQQQQRQQQVAQKAGARQHEVARAAAASVRGNSTAANAVVHAMMKHHKAIEQHGGV